MNLRKTVDEIRSVVVRDSVRRAGAGGALMLAHEEIARLGTAYQQLYSLRDVVGKMPPSPNSIRARAGAVMVRMVQRMLFWYTPQIHRFHNATVMVAENICAAMERQLAATKRLSGEISDLRTEIRLRGADSASPADTLRASESHDLGFDHYLFTLRNHVAAAEEERSLNVQRHLASIESLTPVLRSGPWLDIGCGGGEWLQAAAASGRDATGVDDNLVALSHCRERNLRVTMADPLKFLSKLDDATYSLISMFHTLTRYPARYGWELVREAVRALQPGGILLLELSNPGSLLAGSESAWYDPTVLRPIPAHTARFLLEYFGLEIVAQRALNPAGASGEIPDSDVAFVHQLNVHLYGPEAYAMIARRPLEIREPHRASNLEPAR